MSLSESPPLPDAAKGGRFSSPDRHVTDVANKIENAYPGHVVGVNVPVRDV